MHSLQEAVPEFAHKTLRFTNIRPFAKHARIFIRRAHTGIFPFAEHTRESAEGGGGATICYLELDRGAARPCGHLVFDIDYLISR
jgi:hypothetical protein